MVDLITPPQNTTGVSCTNRSPDNINQVRKVDFRFDHKPNSVRSSERDQGGIHYVHTSDS